MAESAIPLSKSDSVEGKKSRTAFQSQIEVGRRGAVPEGRSRVDPADNPVVGGSLGDMPRSTI